MTAPNRKGTHPTPLRGKHSLLSREAILGGNVTVFYGPGQDPNAAPGYGVRMGTGVEWDFEPDGTPGSEILRVYSPPRDWPRAGALLRVPQVAWLGAAFPYGNYPAVAVTFLGNPYSATFVHPHVAEHARVLSEFRAAREHLEALRPGRTWVSVIDWYEIDAGTFGYQVADTWPHLTAPPLDLDPYFGTDFLHVFAGGVHEVRKLDADLYATVASSILFNAALDGDPGRVLASDPADLVDNLNHPAAVGRVVAALDRFRGYAVRLYSTDVSGFVPLPPYEPSEDDIPDVINSRNGNINFYSDVFVDLMNANERDQAAESIGLLDAEAPGVGAILGVTSDLSEESVVRLIADHFRFDPATGKDL